MSSFLSSIIPRISMPIQSVTMPTHGYPSNKGSSLGFNMGSGFPSTSTIPISVSMLSSASFPFRWNIPSGFGIFPSRLGENMCLDDLIFYGLAHFSLGAHPLGENFHNGVAIHSSIHLVLGGSSLGLDLGILFL
jgi:hypothetical protein